LRHEVVGAKGRALIGLPRSVHPPAEKWEITCSAAADFSPLHFLSLRLLRMRNGTRRRCSAPRFVVFQPVPSHTRLLPLDIRSEAGARTTPTFQHQDDPGHLCPSHYVGQTGGAGDVPDRTVEGLMGEETGNELRCLAHTLVLWAYCGLAQIGEFRISALKCGGQGRS
jgi:hypothetical protein